MPTKNPPCRFTQSIVSGGNANRRKGFEFLSSTWVNAADAPLDGAGEDPVISQTALRNLRLVAGGPDADIALELPIERRFVTTTGGAYLLAPGRQALLDGIGRR